MVALCSFDPEWLDGYSFQRSPALLRRLGRLPGGEFSVGLRSCCSSSATDSQPNRLCPLCVPNACAGKDERLRSHWGSCSWSSRHPGKHRSALRHLELHAFAIRDLIREEHVRLQWVDTKSNPADLLTKAVPSKALFDKFAKLIMGAVDDTAKVFLLSLRSVLVKGRRRM